MTKIPLRFMNVATCIADLNFCWNMTGHFTTLDATLGATKKELMDLMLSVSEAAIRGSFQIWIGRNIINTNYLFPPPCNLYIISYFNCTTQLLSFILQVFVLGGVVSAPYYRYVCFLALPPLYKPSNH